jgi:hypothetical protein
MAEIEKREKIMQEQLEREDEIREQASKYKKKLVSD